MAAPGEDEEGLEPKGVAVFVLMGGLYALGLGLWRFPEVLEVLETSSRMREVGIDPIAPGFPPWLIEYIVALVSGVSLLGGGAIARGAMGLRGRGLPAGMCWAVGGAGFALLVVHAWFTFTHDVAVAEGGMIWGVVHLVTLTREHIPGGATEAGRFGFRIGQAIGLAGIAGWLLTIPILGRVATDDVRPEPPEAF